MTKDQSDGGPKFVGIKLCPPAITLGIVGLNYLESKWGPHGIIKLGSEYHHLMEGLLVSSLDLPMPSPCVDPYGTPELTQSIYATCLTMIDFGLKFNPIEVIYAI